MEKSTSENLAELFFSKLKTSQTPGVILAQFYGALFNVEYGKSEIIKLSKLTKVFGRNSVFFAIIDLTKGSDFTEFPYGLIHYICRTKLERNLGAEVTSASFDSLDRSITEAKKEILKVRKIDPEKAGKLLDERNN